MGNGPRSMVRDSSLRACEWHAEPAALAVGGSGGVVDASGYCRGPVHTTDGRCVATTKAASSGANRCDAAQAIDNGSFADLGIRAGEVQQPASAARDFRCRARRSHPPPRPPGRITRDRLLPARKHLAARQVERRVLGVVAGDPRAARVPHARRPGRPMCAQYCVAAHIAQGTTVVTSVQRHRSAAWKRAAARARAPPRHD